jgi:hypothetical protein
LEVVVFTSILGDSFCAGIRFLSLLPGRSAAKTYLFQEIMSRPNTSSAILQICSFEDSFLSARILKWYLETCRWSAFFAGRNTPVHQGRQSEPTKIRCRSGPNQVVRPSRNKILVLMKRSSRFGRPLARAITPFGHCAGDKFGLPACLLRPDFCILRYLSLYLSDECQCYTVR